MSYLVSARRWRPQTFEDLVGQEHVSRTLTNAIRAGRVAHAFLFTGVRGVGKTTAARILAKALNCEKGPTPTPCNACTNCREITAGGAVDVLEIDGASNTGVDDVREIIENARYRAAKSRFKIYIIDEVHMLSNNAFNALLKTLEEPPPHVKFIFATTDPHKLPATVQSRCQRYDFRRIPLRLVVERLRHIVEAEKIEMSDRSLFMLAREGEGSMRDAQSLLDQVLAGSDGRVRDEDVGATLGIADRQVVFDVGEALIGRDAARALQLLAGVYEHGYDLRRLTRDVLEHFRNLAVARVSDGKLLPDVTDEEAAALRRQAERVSGEDCDRAFHVLQETDEEIGRSPYPKLVLEMAMIKIASMAPLMPIADVLDRIEELDARLRRSGPAGGGGAPPRAKRPAPPASGGGRGATESAPRAAADDSAGPAPPAAGAPAAAWEEFVSFVGQERPALATHLATCRLVAADGPALQIEAPAGFRFNYLVRRDHLAEIEDLARRFFRRDLRAELTSRSAANGTAEAASDARHSSADLTAAALGNPAVRAAMDILGGELAEVRPRRPRRREDG
jgi:DNA polymerase-3 subunit gamma/tau